jgi:hypothetical protein
VLCTRTGYDSGRALQRCIRLRTKVCDTVEAALAAQVRLGLF